MDENKGGSVSLLDIVQTDPVGVGKQIADRISPADLVCFKEINRGYGSLSTADTRAAHCTAARRCKARGIGAAR